MTRRLSAVGAAIAVVVGLLLWFTDCGSSGDCGPAITAPGRIQQVQSASPGPTDRAESPTSATKKAVPSLSAEATSARPSTQIQRIDPASGLRWVDLADLPPEASDTMAAIRAGGPFRFSKDGTTFRNAEQILPRRQPGYYSEFTVVTPGESSRGARRIVTGGLEFGTVNGEFYYTADHYQSFERIRP